MESVELPCLEQTLLLLGVCVFDQVELGLGEVGRVDAVVEEERCEGLVLVLGWDCWCGDGRGGYVGGVVVVLGDAVGNGLLGGGWRGS